MSTATLTSLLDYLYGTLSADNMRWVAEHLMEHARQKDELSKKPYTMEDINTMLDEAEKNIAAGNTIPSEQVWLEQNGLSYWWQYNLHRGLLGYT